MSYGQRDDRLGNVSTIGGNKLIVETTGSADMPCVIVHHAAYDQEISRLCLTRAAALGLCGLIRASLELNDSIMKERAK